MGFLWICWQLLFIQYLESKIIYFECETKILKTSFVHFLKIKTNKAKDETLPFMDFYLSNGRESQECEGNQSRGNTEFFSFLFSVRMREPVMGNLKSERGALTCY